MKIHKIFLLLLAYMWSISALAQWQWIDKDGHKVFSDRPPPADVPPARIVKQPHGQTAPAAAPTEQPAETTENAPAQTTVTPKTASASGTDKALEAKKAASDAAEAAKEKAAEAQRAAARADNCTRAQRAKTTFESNRPIRQTNAQGNAVVLSAEERTAEMRRIQAIISSDCKR